MQSTCAQPQPNIRFARVHGLDTAHNTRQSHHNLFKLTQLSSMSRWCVCGGLIKLRYWIPNTLIPEETWTDILLMPLWQDNKRKYRQFSLSLSHENMETIKHLVYLYSATLANKKLCYFICCSMLSYVKFYTVYCPMLAFILPSSVWYNQSMSTLISHSRQNHLPWTMEVPVCLSENKLTDWKSIFGIGSTCRPRERFIK